MKSHIFRKLKLTAVLIMAGAVALSSLGTAFAAYQPQVLSGNIGDSLTGYQPQQPQARQGLFGTVTAKAQNSLTVKTNQGQTVQLAVTGQTEFRASGKALVTLDDVAVGSRVAVLAEPGASAGALTALKIMLVPGEPQAEHRVLTVVDISGKVIIAEDAQGNRVEVELDHEISPEIKGKLVVFIGAKSEQSNRFKANAEVKIEQIVKRLEDQAKKLNVEVKAEANAEAKAKKESQLVELKARLEANMQRQLDLFAEIIARAPEQARPALTQAMVNTEKGFETTLEALGEAQVGARLKLRTLRGAVANVNIQAGEITLTLSKEAKVALKVTADTQIRIGEKAGALADIAVGSEVSARFNAETLVATELRVKTEADVTGQIQSLDSASGKLVLALASGATVTLQVSSDARIEINGKKAAFADLKVNELVKVKYNVTTMAALALEAETKAEVKGTIKAVDAAAGAVTILAQNGQEVTIMVADTTRVKITGFLFGLLGLSAGMEVEAQYDLVTGMATELKAKKAEPSGGVGQGRLEAEAHGAVQSVDTVNHKLVIQPESGAAVTLTLTAGTEIRINGKQSTEADLKAGMGVEIRYQTGTNTASRINATEKGGASITASGTLKAVNVLANTVTINTQSGEELVLKVNPSTRIVIKGTVSALAVLVTSLGAQLTAEYNAESKVAASINVQATVSLSDTLTAGNVPAATASGASGIQGNVAAGTSPSANATVNAAGNGSLNLNTR